MLDVTTTGSTVRFLSKQASTYVLKVIPSGMNYDLDL